MKVNKDELSSFKKYRQYIETGRFIVVPEGLCLKYKIDGNSAIVLSTIAFYQNGYSEGLTLLQCKIYASKNTVKKILEDLEAKRLIWKEKNLNGGYTYHANIYRNARSRPGANPGEKELMSSMKNEVNQVCGGDNEVYDKERLDNLLNDLIALDIDLANS